MKFHCARPSRRPMDCSPFYLTMGYGASIAYAQTYEHCRDSAGSGGLGTSLSTSGHTTNITGWNETGRRPESVS